MASNNPEVAEIRATTAGGKPARKTKRQRGRRLTDRIRRALARAAAVGRRDVTEELGTLYQARVEEELGRGRQRRARDAGAGLPRTRRKC